MFKEQSTEEIVSELGVYGIAAYTIEEKLKKDNDIRIFDEGYIDKFASRWEQDYEDKDIEELKGLTTEDVEKDIKETEGWIL